MVSNWEVTKVILMSCILSAHELTTPQCPRLEKTPRPSISNVIWILSSDPGTSAATPLGARAKKVWAN